MIYQSVTTLYSGKALVRISQSKRKKKKEKEREGKITRIRMGTFTTPTTFRGHAPWEYHLLLLWPILFFSFFFRGQETLEIPRTSWKLQRKLLVFTRVSHICPANRLLRTGRHMSDNNTNNGKFFVTSNARWNKY